MKLALVCDWYRPRIGGIEHHLEQLAHRLAAAGHEVTVITPTRGDDAASGGVRVLRVRAWLLPWIKLMWTPAAFRRLGAAVRDGGFDFVHVHGSLISPAAYAAVFHAQAAGRPVALTVHSVWDGYGKYFRALDRVTGWTRWPVVFSAVSARAARDLRALVGAAPVHLVPNAVEPAEWRQASTAPTDCVVIACVLRLAPRKRPRALLRAAREVRDRLPAGTRVRWRIAGDGPERRQLERLARTLGVEHDVEFLGAIPPAAVAALLAGSHFFVLPTELEAFGLAALEARAAGLPVVAMKSSGVAEWLRDGIEGLLATDDAEFVQHVLRLIAEPELRAKLAAHNRATPTAFTWERALAEHAALYAEARRISRHD